MYVVPITAITLMISHLECRMSGKVSIIKKQCITPHTNELLPNSFSHAFSMFRSCVIRLGSIWKPDVISLWYFTNTDFAVRLTCLRKNLQCHHIILIGFNGLLGCDFFVLFLTREEAFAAVGCVFSTSKLV